MAEKVPITFEHEGKEYKGSFNSVFGGGGSNIWYLMIDNYYYGRLRLTDKGWVFDSTPKTKSMEALADFFGDYLTAWYQ